MRCMLRVDEDVINTLEVEEAEVEEEEKPAVQTLEEGRQIDGLKFKKKKKDFQIDVSACGLLWLFTSPVRPATSCTL